MKQILQLRDARTRISRFGESDARRRYGAASRQPPPFADAVAAALNPERQPWDAFRKDPT